MYYQLYFDIDRFHQNMFFDLRGSLSFYAIGKPVFGSEEIAAESIIF